MTKSKFTNYPQTYDVCTPDTDNPTVIGHIKLLFSLHDPEIYSSDEGINKALRVFRDTANLFFNMTIPDSCVYAEPFNGYIWVMNEDPNFESEDNTIFSLIPSDREWQEHLIPIS